MKQQDFEQLVTDSINKAKKLGASAVEASASTGKGLSINVRNQEVDTVEFDRGKGFGITVYFGKQKGTASTSDFSGHAIEETIQKACSLAKIMAPDEYCGLAEPELLAQNVEQAVKDLDLYHPWQLEPDIAKDLALSCEQHGLAYSELITNSDGASISSHESYNVYGNSNGFIGAKSTSRHSMSCCLIAQEKIESQKQRDYWYTTSRVQNKLDDGSIVAKNAAKKAIAKLNPKVIKTQHTSVLFTPELTRGLIGHFISAISGGSLYREASFLLDSLGQQVFPEFITITDDPFIQRGFGSDIYDAEGVKTVKRNLIENGILQGYVLGSYSARRLGMHTTGNSGGTHNIIVKNTSKHHNYTDQQDIIKNIKQGLLVTELMGHGINIVTGDYSRGASGFWIENGEVQYPVENITIAGNLKNMLKNISVLGHDYDYRSSVITGSVLIDNMMVAGS